MKEIELTQGYKAMVDDIDYEFLNQFSWCFSHGYAYRKNKNGKTEYMHRLVALRKFGRPIEKVDHKDQYKLNNMRHNVLESNSSKNALNTMASGITRLPQGTFRAQLSVRGIRVLDKVFPTPQEAQVAYQDAKVKELTELEITDLI